MTDSEPEHTTTRLARALEAIPGCPGAIIERARTGYYHDYLSPLDTPEVQLLADLRALGTTVPRASRPLLRALAADITRGKYDATKAEADAWGQTAEGQEAFAELASPRQADPDDSDVIWIKSTRDPDGEPACEVTWGPVQFYAPVDDVRETAIDLVTCAAYAEMMMTLIVRAGIPPEIVQQLTIELLDGRVKRYFGAHTTMTLMPAGSSKRQQALVLLKRGKLDCAVSPEEARVMALAWLQVAEATESDQLVSEALRATGVASETQEKVFGYLLNLRSPNAPAAAEIDRLTRAAK
jgi:hypothetical protein